MLGTSSDSTGTENDLPARLQPGPTWRTPMFRLTAHLASASCTWHRAGSSSIASARCWPTSRWARSAIGHIAGRADIDGSDGRLCGSARSRTPSGSRARAGRPGSAGYASADLDLSSASGGFDIDRADGSVTAKTGDGAIRIGRLTRGQAELLNGSGNIEVGISEGTAAPGGRQQRARVGTQLRSVAGKPRDVRQQGHGPRPPAARRHHHSTRSKLTATRRRQHGAVALKVDRAAIAAIARCVEIALVGYLWALATFRRRA